MMPDTITSAKARRQASLFQRFFHATSRRSASSLKELVDQAVLSLVEPVLCETVRDAVTRLRVLGHDLVIFEQPCHYADYSHGETVRMWLLPHATISLGVVQRRAPQPINWDRGVDGRNLLDIDTRFRFSAFEATDRAEELWYDLAGIIEAVMLSRLRELIVPQLIGHLSDAGLSAVENPNGACIDIDVLGGGVTGYLVIDVMACGFFGRLPESD